MPRAMPVGGRTLKPTIKEPDWFSRGRELESKEIPRSKRLKMDVGGDDKDSVVMMEENKDQDTLGKTPNTRDRDKTLDKNLKKPQKNIKLIKSKKIN